MKLENTQQLSIIKELTKIGIALSSEKNHDKLLEMILIKAQELTNADAGTLYICHENKLLHFKIMITKSLNLHLGGTSLIQSNIKPLSLYNAKGKPNLKMVATYAAITRNTVNIKNAYKEKFFDLSGTFKFDKMTGYHSQSFLTVPLTNHLNEVVGVLQLINAIHKKTKKIKVFSLTDQQIVESLASQSAVTLTNQFLIQEQKNLFDSLLKVIATVIDEKSPYTGDHCRRVPILTHLIADAVCKVDKGPLKNFHMTEDEKYELDVAAWLHDCGKVTTPVHIVDKATKLEAIIDKIHWIDTRFELLKRDAIIKTLSKKTQKSLLKDDPNLEHLLKTLDEEKDFLIQCNQGKEKISQKDIIRIKKIAKRHWHDSSNNKRQYLLTKEEVESLKVSRGTLSINEREIINRHVSISLKMLQSFSYPKNLSKVPLIAGAHHEKINGTGYPAHLTKKDIPIQARILAIADVFEALTAKDRPYKKAMPLSKALFILGQMKVDGDIDPDIFDVFMHYKLYQVYAKDYLDKTLIDKLDLNKIPGYQAL